MEARVAGAEGARGTEAGGEGREGPGRSRRTLWATEGTWASTLREVGAREGYGQRRRLSRSALTRTDCGGVKTLCPLRPEQ